MFPAEAHHVRTKMEGGMGLKSSDFCAIPLCHKHHFEYHSKGKKTFSRKYKINYGYVISRINIIWEGRKDAIRDRYRESSV